MTKIESLIELRQLISTLPPGDMTEETRIARIEELLAACWDELPGEDGGMPGYKVVGRMEDVKWEPPRLSFSIERHGGTVMGSGYAELQSWIVDLERGSKTLENDWRRRWVGGSRNGPLKVGPIAAEIADLVKSGKQDRRLKWKSPDEVRILIGEVIADDCPNQTLAGRRRRFKTLLKEALCQEQWVFTGTNTLKKTDRHA